ncbi:MAG TPA: hypothetical protein DCL44_05430 [Elusimicrobia bacterium]|nr:hypothetical protein [Elusimicrobiota bacterium]
MLKRGLMILAAGVALAASAGAATIDFDTAGTGIDKSELRGLSVPLPSADRVDEKEWTVMVYLNGKNSMEDMAMVAANKLESVGSTDKVNIVMELGRIKGYSSDDGNWTGSRRYLAQKDKLPMEITSPVLASFPGVDMGDYRHLAEFGQWARANFPAKRYMLVVWYGDGWRPKGRALSFDEETYNRISTPQLGQALSQIGRLDIFASDAGMMQMAGVDYEIRKYADYILGSEETSPGEGYPYDTILSMLIYDFTISPENLGSLAVDAFYDYYNRIEIGTLSLVRSERLPRLLALTNDWTAAVMGAGETELVKKAHKSAQSFVYTDNKDLHDFVRLIYEGTVNAAVREKSRVLMEFIQGSLVVNSCTFSDDLVNARGIAVYLPVYGYNPAYDQLAWAKDGNWDEFAQWVMKLK